MMGSIDAWFYRTLAGIQLDEDQPGFEHIILRPFIPDSMSFVRASVQTARGRVATEWDKRNGSLAMKVTIPGNTTATVYVPTASIGQARCTPHLKPTRFEKAVEVFDIGSGDYEFRAPLR
jgi:alpha-L-rhamnosidase